MKIKFKVIACTIGVVILVSILYELWDRRAYIENPCGVYVNEQCERDTLILRPDHTFEQYIYNETGELVFHVKTQWQKRYGYIDVDSLLAIEDVIGLTAEDSTELKELIYPNHTYHLYHLYHSGNLSLGYLYFGKDVPEIGVFYSRIE